MTDRQPRTWTDDEVAQLMELAFDTGRHHERDRIADETIALDTTWLNAARARRDIVIAARIATFTPAEGTVETWMAANLERQRQHDNRFDASTAAVRPTYTDAAA